MGVTPSQLLGLDYVWRGAPRVRLASPSLDTLALDLAWRGAPLVADALEPEPVSLWASPLIELDGAADAGIAVPLYAGGAVSLFGLGALTLDDLAALSADVGAVASAASLDASAGLDVGAGLGVEADAAVGLAQALSVDADVEVEVLGWVGLTAALDLWALLGDWGASGRLLTLPFRPLVTLPARAVAATLRATASDELPARVGEALRAGLPPALPARADGALRPRRR